MYKIMQYNFQGLIITDQKNPFDFLNTVLTSLTESIIDHEKKLKA